jgi:hypothetical protein
MVTQQAMPSGHQQFIDLAAARGGLRHTAKCGAQESACAEDSRSSRTGREAKNESGKGVVCSDPVSARTAGAQHTIVYASAPSSCRLRCQLCLPLFRVELGSGRQNEPSPMLQN